MTLLAIFKQPLVPQAQLQALAGPSREGSQCPQLSDQAHLQTLAGPSPELQRALALRQCRCNHDGTTYRNRSNLSAAIAQIFTRIQESTIQTPTSAGPFVWVQQSPVELP